MNRRERLEKLDQVITLTRQYFVFGYHGGTRYMIESYISKKTGQNIDPILISAALQILKGNGAILRQKNVWWYIADK